MTNKLPVLGKRYKHKTELFEIKVARLATDEIGVIVITECRRPYSSNLFEYLFEEIPDQDLNRSNNTQLEDDVFPDVGKGVEDNRFTDVGKTIEQAKEELREILTKATLSNVYYHEQYKEVRNLAENLLNALNAQEESRKISRIRNLFHSKFSPELIGALETLEENQEILDEKLIKLLGVKHE